MFKKIWEKICNYIEEKSMWKLIELEGSLRRTAFIKFERKMCRYFKLFESPEDEMQYVGNFFEIIVKKIK